MEDELTKTLPCLDCGAPVKTRKKAASVLCPRHKKQRHSAQQMEYEHRNRPDLKDETAHGKPLDRFFPDIRMPTLEDFPGLLKVRAIAK